MLQTSEEPKMLRVLAAFLASGVLCSVTAAAHGQSATAYTDLLYPSGGLRIQAYLYRPDGEGPFPVVIFR